MLKEEEGYCAWFQCKEFAATIVPLIGLSQKQTNSSSHEETCQVCASEMFCAVCRGVFSASWFGCGQYPFSVQIQQRRTITMVLDGQAWCMPCTTRSTTPSTFCWRAGLMSTPLLMVGLQSKQTHTPLTHLAPDRPSPPALFPYRETSDRPVAAG